MFFYLLEFYLKLNPSGSLNGAKLFSKKWYGSYRIKKKLSEKYFRIEIKTNIFFSDTEIKNKYLEFRAFATRRHFFNDLDLSHIYLSPRKKIKSFVIFYWQFL